MTRKEVIGDCTLSRVTFIGFERLVSVYAIESDDVVYVGSTLQPIKHRIRAHILTAKAGSNLPIHGWMREHNFAFSVRLLDRVPEPNRVVAEKHWIAHFGGGLLNLTDGGGGLSGHLFAGSEHSQKIASSLRKGRVFSCLECGDEFWRKPRDVRLGHTKFCSRLCYQHWQRGRPKKRGAAA
ncbi:MAG: hypothetical protein VX464_20755 [Pseudomonadota bacterium]|nr:hypothetical protein [Pseudomonadota bacterium]